MKGKIMFDRAAGYIFKLEGGYVNDPDDSGGATNLGITQNVYDSTKKKDVKNITEAEAESIYLKNYWLPSKCDIIDKTHPALAAIHFDCAVNCGVYQANKLLQRALGVEDDGVIGSITLRSVRMCDEVKASMAYLHKRADFYKLLAKKPRQGKFLKSWIHRLKFLSRMYGIPFNEA